MRFNEYCYARYGIEEKTIVEWWNNIPNELKIQKGNRIV